MVRNRVCLHPEPHNKISTPIFLQASDTQFPLQMTCAIYNEASTFINPNVIAYFGILRNFIELVLEIYFIGRRASVRKLLCEKFAMVDVFIESFIVRCGEGTQ